MYHRNETNKDNATKDFFEMIEKSWTWARLTDKAREFFIDRVTATNDPTAKTVKGSYKERFETLNALYFMFLAGTGYCVNIDVNDWRENAA